jgi:uncharacterized membrane protein YidH (DUF202 family)
MPHEYDRRKYQHKRSLRGPFCIHQKVLAKTSLIGSTPCQMSRSSRYTDTFSHCFVSNLGEPNNTTANERTFLAWIRTSIALSVLGTIIAQLFRLQNAPSPTGVISLYTLATPLACVCQGAALLTALTGGHRYWRMQNAMVRGQALAAGWEFWLMIGISGFVSRPHLTST